jgi:N6-adenosine-specific RNA methylase IME4
MLLANKPFSTIVLDPPWKMTGGKNRGADNHYKVMKVSEIISLVSSWMHNEIIADDAHMYLWVTNTFLEEGLQVMRELGFVYKTNIVWPKNQMGMGQYFRGKHEICLFGVKGKGYNVRTRLKNITSVIKESKRQHSRKPEAFYKLVETRSYGPYIEFFSRANRKGWKMIGNEVGKFK